MNTSSIIAKILAVVLKISKHKSPHMAYPLAYGRMLGIMSFKPDRIVLLGTLMSLERELAEMS